MCQLSLLLYWPTYSNYLFETYLIQSLSTIRINNYNLSLIHLYVF